VKNAIFVFSVLPGSAEVHVISGGIVKRPLIAYFTGSICAKKTSKSVHVCQSYSKTKVGYFSDTVYSNTETSYQHSFYNKSENQPGYLNVRQQKFDRLRVG